ncbi:MAG: T9SS type A sorting domain-containing protein [Saprospiraceae bacterium]|nr:T9SS type A sorting domain-containing protein [Saprospiraceae bacterium]
MFTSVNPGGWWDTTSPSNLYQQIMSMNDSATFTSNASNWYNENYSYIHDSDTIPVFWQAIAPEWILKTTISEHAQPQLSVKAYPNPFSQQLTFSLSDDAQTTVSVCSLLGQQEWQYTFTNTITIDTNHLEEGIYYYMLQNDKGIIKTGKIVKK